MTSAENQGKTDGNDGDAIKVFVRIRPPDSYELDVTNQMCISVDDSKRAVIVQTKPECKVFTFDHVADIHATQDNIFSMTGKKIIESCVNGYNGTIFAYGQTGSGKTFTMVGPSEEGDNFQHELRGVIPRSFEYLFNLVHREQELHGKGKEFLLKCSFLEIYHEQIFDLLEPSTISLHLRENMKKGVFVDGLAEVSVTSAIEAYNVLNSGWINRRVASTSMNRESSRSHAVFTIQIESKEKKGAGVQNLKESQLNLVDLAGSERQKDTNAVGQRLKEAGSINRSLSILGNVIMSLVDIAHGKNRHIPYRDSRLTFLLRDSLGGNAKTQIIACIHPGSKSFGETMSTLQFARRAKMIKNKAIINEDTQGNVLSLQLELKRLKEVLAQLQSGAVPQNPSGSTGCIPSQSSSSDLEWKERFINAMLFREKAEFDKKALKEKLENLEELCKKKEKFLQSTKMIIKFRENNISRLEKAMKNNGITDNQILETVSDLKAEIEVLKEQLAHHPQVTKYAVEIQHLKAELNHMKGHGNNVKNSDSEIDNRKLEQIERAYKELLTEKQKETEKTGGSTPSHTPKTGNEIATATVEKFKSQIEKYKEEIELLKQNITEQKEKAEKKELELNSDLESYKKANAELNTVLEAHQIKSKIEKEAMHDRHLQTVKTITTPRKAKYNLRNRVISVPASAGNTPSLDDSSILFEEGTDLITEETEPDFIAEQAHEAFVDEIKQLQELNCSLTQRLEEYEADMIRLRQHISKVDHQNGVLNEMLEKERSNWGSFSEKNNSEIATMTHELEETKLSAKLMGEECNDLKILLSSADKELTNIKARNQILEEKHQKAVDMLETKLMQVDLELSKMNKEYETVSEERDSLLQSLETAQDTLNFNESMVKELEEHVQKLTREKCETEKQIQGLKAVLVQEEEKNKDLMSKMDAAGEAQEKIMYNLMEEKNQINQDLCMERARQQELKDEVSELKSHLETSQSMISSQEKQLEQSKEAISSFMTKIQELKSELSVSADLVETQTEYIQDLENEIQKKSKAVEDLQKNLSDFECQFERQNNSHEMEVSMLKDDLEDAVNNLESYRHESNRNEEEMKELKNSLNKMLTQVHMKEEEKNQLQSELQSLKTLHSLEVSQLQEQLSMKETAETERDLTRELESKQEEINLLRGNQQSLNRKIEDYEDLRRQKNQEIQNLKEELDAKEKLHNDIQQWKAKYEMLKYESESEKKSHNERFDEVQKQLDGCTTDLQKVQTEVEHYKSVNAQMGARLLESNNEREKFEEMEIELDRLQEVVRKHHKEKEENYEEQQFLRSVIEKLREKESKLLEENSKLIGHQNLKQKIHHTQQLKEELVLCKEQVLHLQKENNHFQSLLKYHNILPTPKKSVLKENNLMSRDDPESDVKSTLTAKATTKRQKFFYSGDYT